MASNNIQITYQFNLNNQKPLIFDLNIHPTKLEYIPSSPREHSPAWTDLGFKQCSHCPLKSETHPQCPVAQNLVPVVSAFDDILSYKEIGLTVTTDTRVVKQRTTAQRAVSSLMGLIIATSNCPYTAFFKAMAVHHLPLATQEETICRSTSLFLLAQHIENKNTISDLSTLTAIYKNMQIVNIAIAERLRAITKSDSMVNAIVILDMLAQAMPFVVDESLEDIKYLFLPYLNIKNKYQ